MVLDSLYWAHDWTADSPIMPRGERVMADYRFLRSRGISCFRAFVIAARSAWLSREARKARAERARRLGG